MDTSIIILLSLIPALIVLGLFIKYLVYIENRNEEKSSLEKLELLKQGLLVNDEFYNLNNYRKFFKNLHTNDLDINEIKKYMVVSTGINDKDFLNLCDIMDNIEGLKWVCIDVANGYMQKMIPFCKKVRERYPKLIIIAGNVATSEMTQEYIINYAPLPATNFLSS